MYYTVPNSEWKFNYVTEDDRPWLTRVLEGDEYTPDQAIELGLDTRVPAPSEPPYPSFFVSRIYSKNDVPILWMLSKVESNTHCFTSIVTDPNFRGQGLTHEMIQAGLKNKSTLQNWVPESMLWLVDKKKWTTHPAHYNHVNIEANVIKGSNYSPEDWSMHRVTRR